MTFKEFKNNVELWAAERGIYDHSSTSAQLMKAMSELGELADAIIQNDDDSLKDAVGDVTVCVLNAAYLADVSLDEVAERIADIINEADASESTLPAKVVGWVAEGIGAYLSGRSTDTEDAFRAPLLALFALCAHKGLDFMDCCEHAWNEIRDRKGRMVAGGAFVKDEEGKNGPTGTCNPTTGKTVGFEPHPELVKLANSGVSDGSTASYYRLPEGSEQLQDLISYRNMNGQIAEIFRSCYRYGRASHSDQLRDAKKIAFYAQAEVERLEKYECED